MISYGVSTQFKHRKTVHCSSHISELQMGVISFCLKNTHYHLPQCGPLGSKCTQNLFIWTFFILPLLLKGNFYKIQESRLAFIFFQPFEDIIPFSSGLHYFHWGVNCLPSYCSFEGNMSFFVCLFVRVSKILLFILGFYHFYYRLPPCVFFMFSSLSFIPLLNL